MPELPEVETIRRDLVDGMVGKRITTVVLDKSKVIRGKMKDVKKSLTGARIRSIDRIGKLLMIELDHGEHLLFHLKMTGQLFLHNKNGGMTRGGHSLSEAVDSTLPNKYTHAVLTIENGAALYFNDMRLFAFLQIVDDAKKSAIVATYGIEPLTKQFTFENFHRVFKGRKTSVKAVLLNQSRIAGIGNIYADEICFAARVRPQRSASTLKKSELLALFQATEKVIAMAIEKRGTTFNSYIDGQGKKGSYLKELKVYGRQGEECLCCGTPLKKIRTAGRGTVFCPACQR